MWMKAALAFSLIGLAGCQTSEDVIKLDSDAPLPTAEHTPSLTVEQMFGSWDVDLRPTPTADAYLVPMTFNRNDDGTYSATFYGGVAASEIQVNSYFEEPHVAFITNDGSSDYHTTFRLVNENELRGTTHSVGRDFLAVWSAKRSD